MAFVTMRRMIEIDGAQGGGAVLRVGVGLAVAMRLPVCIKNIRQARTNPGLQAQHLAGLLSTAELCDARLDGAQLGSSRIELQPGEIRRTTVRVSIATAGSVGLALQPLQLACLGARHRVDIEIIGGGTFGKWAPPTPFIENVNFALLKRYGFASGIKIGKHGFYPRGGASARAHFELADLSDSLFLTERGALRAIHGISIATRQLQAARVAERQREAAFSVLKEELHTHAISIDIEYVESLSVGSSLVLWADYEKTILGADALGERGVSAEKVGQTAAWHLLTELQSEATLDTHMADQIIPFLGLYGGSFRCSRITDHIKTNLALVEQITGTSFQVNDRSIKTL
jgi:RNA 3'-phosphate cyclase